MHLHASINAIHTRVCVNKLINVDAHLADEAVLNSQENAECDTAINFRLTPFPSSATSIEANASLSVVRILKRGRPQKRINPTEVPDGKFTRKRGSDQFVV